jgi:hypothetical protein
MNEALLNALRTHRTDIANGRQRSDARALANQMQDLGVSVPTADLQGFIHELFGGFGRQVGEYFVPTVMRDVISLLLEGRSAKIACDPWAGLGVLAARVHEDVHAGRTLVCVATEGHLPLARVLAPQLEWHSADPSLLLAN